MSTPVGLLPIRLRRTVSQADGIAVEPLIYCPHGEQTIGIDDCAECPDYGGLSIDVHGEHSVVRCSWQDACCGACNDAVSCGPRPGKSPPPWSSPPPLAGPTNAGQTRITAAMSGDVVCVRSDVTVEALAAMFLDCSFSGAPVVDRSGRLIGVVSKTDLLRRQAQRAEEQESSGEGVEVDLPPDVHLEPSPVETVGSLVSTPHPIALHENATLAQAAAVMAYEKIHRLPVISRTDEVVGILTSLDVMRWLAEHNGYVLPPRRSLAPA